MTLWRFVGRSLAVARQRALLLGVGLLVAALGFSVLNAESVSSTVAVRGTLNRSFQPAYDILVRPAGSASAIETSRGLVDDGFLSDLFGGISLRQWHRILKVPGVSVAAPIENVGYALTIVFLKINMAPVLGHGSQEIFRVVPSFVVHGGLARYPVPDQYFYYSTDEWVGSGPSLIVPGHHRPVRACLYLLHPAELGNAGPFATRANEAMVCGGPHQNVRRGPLNLNRPGDDAIDMFFQYPVLVSAIDPVQEAKLVNLPRAMVSGRYLGENEGISAPVATRQGRQFELHIRKLPLLASSRLFLDEHLRVVVQRLAVDAAGSALPLRLASPGAGDYLDARPGPVVLTRTFSTGALYRRTLSGFTSGVTGVGNYFTTSGVRFRSSGRRSLIAQAVTNPGSVWKPTSSTAVTHGGDAPPGANATQYRRLSPYNVTGTVVPGPHGPVYLAPGVALQGTFDPSKLPGFSPLSRVPLSTFFAPTVTGADPASRRVLHGRPLGPTTDVGGYLAQPPLFLTTLKAAAPFFDSSVFTGQRPRLAPIAAIEVRVSRLHGASRASIARVEQVATAIYRATGLRVDITAGSSPTTMRIDLAPGGFGEPALAVDQGWVRKGVATVVLNATNAKGVAFFVLVLIVAGLFVTNAVLASVRQRRTEIATLATVGWQRRQIFAAVLSEVAVIGLAAGLVGAAVSAAVVAAASLHLTADRILPVIPAAVIVAVAAGLLPAWQASRLSPLEGLAPPVRAKAAARRVRSITRLGLANLARVPSRTIVGGLGLVVGVGALAFILGIQDAFSGAVAGDLLGNHINIEVQGADYAAVALILLLAAGSVADVLILNLRERAGELAALQACGWGDPNLRQLVVTEGLGIGVVGSLIGAGLGLAGVTALGAPPAEVAAGTAATFVAGVALCAVALLPALSLLTRQLPALALAAE